uniref:Uncharacterized protein n=1 Tax=Bionectria ochroleuca TaxID=29856 RepID=A0A8H7NDP1_BIOOC
MRENRRIRDAEAIPVTGLRTLAPEHYSRLVPVDYNEQQWSQNRNLYDTAPRSPAQNYQRRIEPETGPQRAGEGVAQPPYHYTQHYGGMIPADESRDPQRYRPNPFHRPLRHLPETATLTSTNKLVYPLMRMILLFLTR